VDWRISGSVVVITGAAHGIGRATADVFAAEGASRWPMLIGISAKAVCRQPVGQPALRPLQVD
jgi:NAD(P)-dependent dehydrogenase (short-subunit alcohol dehydrogenase family)